MKPESGGASAIFVVLARLMNHSTGHQVPNGYLVPALAGRLITNSSNLLTSLPMK